VSYMSFETADLDQPVNIEITLRQAIHISNLLSFHLESGLSVDEQDMMEAYEAIFSSIESFGNIDT
jgi:hypothetical protein